MIITHANAGVKRLAASVCASVCLFVCLPVRTITQKRLRPKRSNLVYGMILGHPINDMILGSKGQRSRSQGHKMQKHIEDDRVAGVSLNSI